MVNPSIAPRVRHRKAPSKIIIDGDIARVELTRGFEAIIDASDVPLVARLLWQTLIVRGRKKYAMTRLGVMMHRMILGAEPAYHVDHEDGDGLNNRRGNLRLATRTQNRANASVSANNLLQIKGVSRRGGKYTASINPGGKMRRLGSFDTAEEAAEAYLAAARALWGEFAKG